jgi:hypothetical protein
VNQQHPINLDRFVARSQFVLAYTAVFAIVVCTILILLFIAGGGRINGEVLTLLGMLLTGLLALAKDGYSYFFQRQRPKNGDGEPDDQVRISTPTPDAGGTVSTTVRTDS